MASCPHPYDLQSYVDDALALEHEQQVRRHIATCPDCAECVTELERIHGLINAEPIEPPEGLLERLLQIVRHASPVRRLSCRQAQRMASEYIDDELSQSERETLEVHLFACDECFYEYMAMRRAAHIMRQAPPVTAPNALKDRIIQAVSEQSEQEETEPATEVIPLRLRWKRIVAPAAAVAAVALLAFGIMYVATTLGPTTQGATMATAQQPSHKVVSRGEQPSTDAAVDPSGPAGEATAEDADEQPDDAAAEDAAEAADSAADTATTRESTRHRSTRDRRPAADRSPRRPQQPERRLAADADAGGDDSDAALPERTILPGAGGAGSESLASRSGNETTSLAAAERTARRRPNEGTGFDTGSGLPEPPSGTGSVPDADVLVQRVDGEGGEDDARVKRPSASAKRSHEQPIIRPEVRREIAAQPEERRSAPENAYAERPTGVIGPPSVGHSPEELNELLQDMVNSANVRIEKEAPGSLIEQEDIRIDLD